jgi:GAF domain-containing protein
MELGKNEAKRLAVLHGYGLLDTNFEERFDRLTRLTSRMLGTPISLISLVDEDRQWFKAACGLKIRETPRDVSFCAHAIQGSGVFVVPDATKDERFAENPLVTGDPQIRFYAGAPLIGFKGQAIGTLCVIDRKPRKDFTAAQQQILRDLADTLVDIFDLRLALSKTRALKRELNTIASRLVAIAK